MKDFSLLPARPEHAVGVYTAQADAAEQLGRILGPGPWTAFNKLPSVRARIREGEGATISSKTIFVGSIAGEVVGAVSLSRSFPNFFRKPNWAEPGARALGVFGLAVHPSHQGRGYGRAIMGQVEELARCKGFAFVRLDAYADNPLSVGFYSHLGYNLVTVLDLRGTCLAMFEKPV